MDIWVSWNGNCQGTWKLDVDRSGECIAADRLFVLCSTLRIALKLASVMSKRRYGEVESVILRVGEKLLTLFASEYFERWTWMPIWEGGKADLMRYCWTIIIERSYLDALLLVCCLVLRNGIWLHDLGQLWRGWNIEQAWADESERLCQNASAVKN